MKDDAFVLDVRSKKEFDDFHLESAVNIPVPELRTRFNEVNKEPVIILCASGHRSSMAAGILQSKGIKNVINVPGGITAWRAAGYTSSCPVTDNVHGPQSLA
jgi:rhodanese-related sulfurtransferase